MSIFITLLAFNDSTIIDASTVAIKVSSLLSGIIGFDVLKLVLK